MWHPCLIEGSGLVHDAATPVGSNYQAAPSGATAGPPAPPRDARKEIGDLFECFDS